ncbi:MAG: class I SAM-dependent methyltransferase [Parachlamydia sp.]|jgi:hypothetical protein|nr:class I SAM-dependent methyltransferase [Parachlamydia sp.]
MGWALFIALSCLIVSLIVGYSVGYGISPTPTSPKVRRALALLLPQDIEGAIKELGSGWGHLAFWLALRYPNTRIDAYEISPLPYMVSKALLWGLSFPHLKFHRKDFFKIDLSDSRLLICYLYPGAMERLKEKFEKELKPGTWVLTHTFSIPGWKPLKIAYADDLYRTPVYLYQFSISTSW